MLLNESLYSKQFIVGPRRVTVPNLTAQDTFAASTFVSYHPNLTVTHVSISQREILCFGIAVDPCNPHWAISQILDGVLSNSNTFAIFEQKTACLGGRWIMLVKIGDQIRLYPDAAGSKSTFFFSSVDKEVWVASQPNLFRDALGITINKRLLAQFLAFPHQNSWPGNTTPFDGTYQLLPNHFLDLVSGEYYRFWPTESLPQYTLDDAALVICNLLHGTIESALSRGSVAMPLTGGYDSRSLFASAKELQQRLELFVITDPSVSSYEVAIPRRLAKTFRAPFRVIRSRAVDQNFWHLMQQNIGGMWWDPGEHRIYTYGAAPGQLLLLGLVSEVLRCFYYKDGNHPLNIGAELLASTAGYSGNPVAMHAFAKWLSDVPLQSNINVLDLFYWEHRLGNWGSLLCTALDTVAEVLSPYNCRRLLEIGLGVNISGRSSPYLLHRRICELAAPRSLDIPFNYSHYDQILSLLARGLPWRVKNTYRRARMRLAGFPTV